MVELRWLLDPEHPPELKDTAPLDAFTLQYRIKEMCPGGGWEWTAWRDVLFISEGE